MTTLTVNVRDFSPPALTTFSSVVGFYFAFRLVAVVIAVRLFQAEPQIGVAASLVLNYLMLDCRGISVVRPRLTRVLMVLPPCKLSMVSSRF